MIRWIKIKFGFACKCCGENGHNLGYGDDGKLCGICKYTSCDRCKE